MARAAFIMDRLMSKVGLHGKSFIPMLSSFACAIPGIMATRTIESRKDRLVTILVAPLMSCSARLPVYALMIALLIPSVAPFEKAGIMLCMYPGEALSHSFAGQMGHAIEPVIAPLGFDWKIGIGLIGSFAAREVFVSTMSIVYNVETADKEQTESLKETMRREHRSDGKPIYTPLVCVSLMIFYVLAMQCVSTVAIVRRETNSWRWPLFQIAYMTALAWTGSFLVYQGGRWFGWE